MSKNYDPVARSLSRNGQRVALTSFHRAWSYGGALQCLASQTLVEMLGYDTLFIDYWRPDMVNPDRYYAERVRRRFGPFGAAFYMHVRKPTTAQAAPIFADFQARYLRIASPPVYTLGELRANFPDADVYVVASDQVWNDNDNSRDGNGSEPYFLSYLPKSAPRIALASSFGKSQPTESELANAHAFLQSFKSVSVREPGAVSVLREAGIDAVHVVDPTLLLTQTEWISVLGLSPTADDRHELLCYGVGRDSGVEAQAVGIAKAMDLPYSLVSLRASRYRWKYRFAPLPTVPGFVDMVRQSRIVVTDSFHGAVFCVLFHVPFIAVTPKNYPARMLELLSLFGLEDRLAHSGSHKAQFGEIDWENVDKRLTELRLIGRSWLTDALKYAIAD